MAGLLAEDMQRTLGERLGRYFARRLRNPADAADATQETFLRLLNAAPAETIDNPQAYVFRMARNLVLDHARRERVRAGVELPITDEQAVLNVPCDAASPEMQVIDRQRLMAFDHALAALPPRAQQAFVLSRIEGWTYPAIAHELGVSPNTVYGDVRMALAHCLDALARIDRP